MLVVEVVVCLGLKRASKPKIAADPRSLPEQKQELSQTSNLLIYLLAKHLKDLGENERRNKNGR
jgi:hypothetical protein